MPYPSVFMVHECVITQRRPSAEKDAYGADIMTETVLPPRKCRFSVASSSSSANGFVSSANVSLQYTEDIQEDDMITSTDSGFDRVYWVNGVKQVYEATGKKISHTVATLRETEAKVML